MEYAVDDHLVISHFEINPVIIGTKTVESFALPDHFPKALGALLIIKLGQIRLGHFKGIEQLERFECAHAGYLGSTDFVKHYLKHGIKKTPESEIIKQSRGQAVAPVREDLSCELAIRHRRLHVYVALMSSVISRLRLPVRLVTTVAWAMLVTSCFGPVIYKSKVKPKVSLGEKHYVSYDDDEFGYRKWVQSTAAKKDPAIVVIGVHGISGHAGDFENLGNYLLEQRHDVAVYAAEIRGQGMDAKLTRRGDIRRVEDWYRDLYTFTGLVRSVHPTSKIVWFGESMGSLIVAHAFCEPPPGFKLPDAIVISSPIIEVESKLATWQLLAARLAAVIFPKAKISLESLAGDQKPVVTRQDIHEQQAAKNPWYIRRFTLRLLIKVGDMAAAMDDIAKHLDCPVLVLHGGQDIFTEDHIVDDFYDRLPDEKFKTHKFYPGSYHLLMYDHDRAKIFGDISKWLSSLKDEKRTNK